MKTLCKAGFSYNKTKQCEPLSHLYDSRRKEFRLIQLGNEPVTVGAHTAVSAENTHNHTVFYYSILQSLQIIKGQVHNFTSLS